jgi:transcriptional regulator with XRE-family HTH domain
MLRTKLRRARKLKGMTQKMLSEKSEISQPLIAKYELGHKPSPRNLKKLCDALGVSIEYFNGPVSNTNFFDDDEFKSMLKQADRLSQKNKMMVSVVLSTALDYQKMEDSKG